MIHFDKLIKIVYNKISIRKLISIMLENLKDSKILSKYINKISKMLKQNSEV